jgi:hypothetical protein
MDKDRSDLSSRFYCLMPDSTLVKRLAASGAKNFSVKGVQRVNSLVHVKNNFNLTS